MIIKHGSPCGKGSAARQSRVNSALHVALGFWRHSGLILARLAWDCRRQIPREPLYRDYELCARNPGSAGNSLVLRSNAWFDLRLQMNLSLLSSKDCRARRKHRRERIVRPEDEDG